jgi:hypothetical protein
MQEMTFRKLINNLDIAPAKKRQWSVLSLEMVSLGGNQTSQRNK